MSALRVAAAAQRELYSLIAGRGTSMDAIRDMMSRAELYDLLGLSAFEVLDRQIERTTYTES